MAFDPLAHLPDNVLPNAEYIDALVGFYSANGRAPTPAEAVSLTRASPEYPPTRLPDGFAGREWGNPGWLRRLVAAA